jgi:hypothetical protein
VQGGNPTAESDIRSGGAWARTRPLRWRPKMDKGGGGRLVWAATMQAVGQIVEMKTTRETNESRKRTFTEFQHFLARNTFGIVWTYGHFASRIPVFYVLVIL